VERIRSRADLFGVHYGPSASDGSQHVQPRGWIGSRSVATELRYLRKERHIASDLVLFGPWDRCGLCSPGERKHAIPRFFRNATAAVTVKSAHRHCGKGKTGSTGVLQFLSTVAISNGTANSECQPRRLFCSGQLGPGKYYLYFARGSDAG